MAVRLPESPDAFSEAVWAEAEGRGAISKDEFWELFKLGPFVRHLDTVFGRLEKLDVAQPASSPAGPQDGE